MLLPTKNRNCHLHQEIIVKPKGETEDFN
uniref:Uncharacterized protein n=1 Tax=Anguilla anguilla TaxID=7936 RepID=A0A0E9R9W7_ANGAN